MLGEVAFGYYLNIMRTTRNYTMIYVIRSVHIALGILFLACIGTIYWYAIVGARANILYLAIVPLLLEGAVLVTNKGQCPLTSLQHKYGDDKGFFDLFLPKWILPWVIPVLSVVSVAGIVLALT